MSLTSRQRRVRGPYLCAICFFIGAADQLNAESPFTEESVARGISYATSLLTDVQGPWGRGVAFVDLDGDGDPDFVAIGRNDGLVGVFENDGTGNFVDRSLTTMLPPLITASGVTAADYDADGDLDLYFSVWGGDNVLARNEGNFTFTDVSIAANVNSAGWGAGCAWGDFDLDGWIDLYASNRMGTYPADTNPNRLYRNLGNGTFEDVAVGQGVTNDGLAFQAVFFDMDRDGDADLYVTNDRGYATGLPNHLFRNDGGNYVDISASSGTDVAINAMGIAVGDVNGDGTPDLYVTNTQAGNPLFLNQGNGIFLEQSAIAGVESFQVGWGTSFLDYNNDGYLDLYVCNEGTPNRLYSFAGGWPCSDLAPLLACDDSNYSYGLAVADIDDDGDLDFAVQNELNLVRLYINNEGQSRNWIKFDVVGQSANLFGIGAVVEITAGGVTQFREVSAGGTFKSQNELKLHFGIGDATVIDQVHILWPGGQTRTIQNLNANQTLPLYPPERLGDFDADGTITPADVGSFLQVLLGADDSADHVMLSDMNGDGHADGADVALFVNRYLVSP